MGTQKHSVHAHSERILNYFPPLQPRPPLTKLLPGPNVPPYRLDT